MTQGADYSGGRPSGAALRAAGFDFVIRYVGLGSSGKLLTAPEYRDLTGAGLQVLLVAELGTADSWGSSNDDDYSRGRNNATAALNHARNCGVPDDEIFIFGASDSHASAQWQIDDTVDYMRGYRDVLGGNREGHYGFSETQRAVYAAGVSSGFWRCGSRPTGADASWVNFWQRNAAPTTRVVAGVACDINEKLNDLNVQEAPDMDSNQAAQLNYLYQVFQRYPVGAPNGKVVDGVWTGDGAEFIRRVDATVTALTAKVDGLISAVSALSTSPGLDTATVTQIVNDAVAQHIQITGTVNITGSAA